MLFCQRKMQGSFDEGHKGPLLEVYVQTNLVKDERMVNGLLGLVIFEVCDTLRVCQKFRKIRLISGLWLGHIIGREKKREQIVGSVIWSPLCMKKQNLGSKIETCDFSPCKNGP